MIISLLKVWVGTVGYGPNGTSLLANYNNSETLTFQDSVGKVVLEICKVKCKSYIIYSKFV